jgi:hypothetical protein
LKPIKKAMKTKFQNLLGIFGLATIIMLSACSKDEFVKDEAAMKTIVYENCEATFTLWAGNKPQTDVGTVKVSNNNEYIFVEFNVTAPWILTETHVDIQTAAQIKRGAPGKYNSNDYLVSLDETTAFYQIPIGDLEPGNVIYILAHAAVINPETGADETAYGGEYQNRKPWYNMITYTIQENCVPPPPNNCDTETAWANGPRYEERGNWAMYTPYVANSTVILFAGKTLNAGTVHFSEVIDGEVTLTITFNSGFSFQPVNENIKIQDYAVAPSGNPSPGGFDHKFTDMFVVKVPANNFYGIHLDVLACE